MGKYVSIEHVWPYFNIHCKRVYAPTLYKLYIWQITSHHYGNIVASQLSHAGGIYKDKDKDKEYLFQI